MATDVNQLIAAINPDLFCDNAIDPTTGKSPKDEVKEILKEEIKKGNKHPYLKAAEKARLKVGDFMNLEDIDSMAGVFKLDGIKNAVEQHVLVYDAFGESLEPIYFWILDNVRGKVTKLTDSFASTPSSSFFAEMGTRGTKMQEEAMKMLGVVNTVIKSVLNILYDLKEFKIRLEAYKDYSSTDVAKKSAAFLSLKQIWLDQVDIKRGNTAIKAMAQQFEYVTLIDAFMASESTEQLNKKEGEAGFIDLNERVRRLLLQRFGEFEKWLKESERELTKRYDIEKNYLKSQMATLKLYARWVKPYLKAAHDLEQADMKNPALVTAFNTMILELKLLVEGKYDPIEDIQAAVLPEMFKRFIEKKKRSNEYRNYIPIMIVEFSFRSGPERMNQGGYGFRGKVEVKFTSYALNDKEKEIFLKEIEEDDIGDSFKLIEQATGESIESIEKDIKDFLDEDSGQKKEEEEAKEKGADVNPFSALFSFGRSDKKKDGEFSIAKDDDMEQAIRSRALIESRKSCRKFYDIYKKAHNMPAFPGS